MFTGTVERRELLSAQQHAGMRLGWVKFDDGARTNWHVHDGEQILYVTEGLGCVGTDHATMPIGGGDTAAWTSRWTCRLLCRFGVSI